MNFIDILLLVPLVWASVVGFKLGTARQLSGFAGVLIGVWLGFKLAYQVGWALRFNGQTAQIIGFVVVVIAAIALCSIVGWFLGKMIKWSLFGMVDTIGGMVLSAVKMALLIGVLLVLFDMANIKWRIIKQTHTQASMLFEPIKKFPATAFPIVERAQNELFDDTTE